jgi:hypothetical protein
MKWTSVISSLSRRRGVQPPELWHDDARSFVKEMPSCSERDSEGLFEQTGQKNGLAEKNGLHIMRDHRRGRVADGIAHERSSRHSDRGFRHHCHIAVCWWRSFGSDVVVSTNVTHFGTKD